ncbi:MAG: PQQ-dependent sugar dehydrogenase [Thermoleophilaceae bacterium]
MRPAVFLSLLAFLASSAGCGDEQAKGEPSSLPAAARESGTAEHFALRRVASGLVRPTYVGVAPGDRDGLYVLEQPGRLVRVGRRGPVRTLVDLRNEVVTGAEQGLLGLAFHPGFARNRRLYLHWTDLQGDTRVAEFTLGAGKRRELLFVDQPEENHNGGQLAFGPDGRLYLGLGDGGGAFDPHRNAQDTDDLLGKLISADVDADGEPGWRVELYGLRNPWRFSFDAGLNDVWIGDVGQDGVEEVNRVALEADEPPKNLGWPAYEGTRRLKGKSLDTSGELVVPAAEYTHEDGCSITGGVVYRGTELPELAGRYVYGDFCTGAIWSLHPKPGRGADDVRRERARRPQLTHIGVDSDGELLFATANGDIARGIRP